MNGSPKLRVGIVGCGYQGDRLARAIALVDALTVTACADIIPERAVELAAFAGNASAYATAEELLANSEVDIVMVATPHHVLAPISLLAIQEAASPITQCEAVNPLRRRTCFSSWPSRSAASRVSSLVNGRAAVWSRVRPFFDVPTSTAVMPCSVTARPRVLCVLNIT